MADSRDIKFTFWKDGNSMGHTGSLQADDVKKSMLALAIILKENHFLTEDEILTEIKECFIGLEILKSMDEFLKAANFMKF